jgi:hypothetical protein
LGKGYAWFPAAVRMYRLTTGASTVTSYTDYRGSEYLGAGILNKALSDADTVLTGDEQINDIQQFTGTLTAQRNIIWGDITKLKTVLNNTTGGFGLQFKTANGTGVVVATTKRAILYADGTNVVRVTADT